MTVETTARKQSFAGGQSTLTFTFRALTSTPEDVKVVAVSSGTETLLAYTSGYTVAVAADGIGGVVTVSPTYSTNYTYTVYRETTNTQESDYDDYNQFPADTLENDLDRRCMIEQEQGEDIARSLKVPVSSALTGSSLNLPTPDAGKGLIWNATANGLTNTDDDVADIVSEASNYASTASTQAAASVVSAAAALASETAAGLSATTASTQATLASNYATSASTSAISAATSATTAVTSEYAAGTYSTLAGLYATTASTSAALAGLYASTASTQATTASTQAALSGNYATTASTAATLAGNYATTASTSATLAGNYATTASTAAATIPSPVGATVADLIRINAAQTAYELFTPAASGVTVKTGTFSKDISDASATTSSVSGIGVPKIVYIMANVNDTDKTAIGFGDGTNQYTLHDYNGESAGKWGNAGGRILFVVQAAGAYYRGDLSIDANGFTITWTKTGSPTGTLVCNWFALT